MERVDYQSLIIQDLINLEQQEELNLNPWYQRRSVWNDSQKSYLINTLFERKPIPALYIRHSIDLERGKSIKEVVDGQQRTRSILDFINNKFSALHTESGKRIKFEKLTKSQKEAFLLTPLPVGYLQGATDKDVIDIFARINSNAKTLNAQEKRNAIYSGAFKQSCTREAIERLEFWRNYEIFSANDIARMSEVQFMSDLIINLKDGLSGYSSTKLNKYYKEFDSEFEDEKQIENRLNYIFDTIININPSAIRETIFKRPPLFFSVLMVIDELKPVNRKKIETALFDIDANFNSDIPIAERERQDIEFYNASSATTQGSEQRRIRNEYIKSFIE